MTQKPIIYSEHLKHRLLLRRIPYEIPKLVLEHPDRVLRDAATGYGIAVKEVEYSNKKRLIMVAFEEIHGQTVAVTSHPIDNKQIENKTQSSHKFLNSAL